jgi:hypothetical protein
MMATQVEVRCNDFSNPLGIATTAPADDSGRQVQFQVTGKRLGRVMLEARQPSSDNDWFQWPLYASVQLLVATDSPQEAAKRSSAYQASSFHRRMRTVRLAWLPAFGRIC